MFDRVYSFIQENIESIHVPKIQLTDVVEIAIISFVVYHIMVWIRKTKAWSLLKGLIVILGFLFLAAIFNMSTILWIAEKSFSVLLMVMVVVLQPELRRALEQLGQKNIFFSFLSSDANKQKGRYSDQTINEIVKAAFAMGRVKTGALMVFERNETLAEWEKTGIVIDAAVSSQLLINIFEHNTPLHDGAVIFRGDRIVAAVCILPLSNNPNISKALGTRHRAGVGISEATDSLTVIVSEENGKVSVAYGGELYSGLNQEGLREKLEMIQDKPQEESRRGWLDRSRGDKAEKGERNGKKADK